MRTSSGTVEYHIKVDDGEQPKTQGELLPNGTVRLSKKGKAGRNSNQKTHSPMNTRFEIGAGKPNQK